MARTVIFASIALASISTFAQTPDEAKSLQQFVQAFYDWYVPIANKPTNGPSFHIALKQRPELFNPELLKALQADLNSQAKSPGEIVGVDWDPFLNAQDPEQQYKVGSIQQSRAGFWVNIHAINSGEMSKIANVIAEVSKVDGHWIFNNFRSPRGIDLLSSLAHFRKQRNKTTK